MLDGDMGVRDFLKFMAFGLTFSVPLLIGGFVAWGNLEGTLAILTTKTDAQPEEIKRVRDEVAVVSARQADTDEKVMRIMFYFRVPQQGPPFTVYPPSAQQHGKVEPPSPLKGHALFDTPQTLADAPSLPVISTTDDH